LRALESLPLVKIHYGNFLTNEKWAGLVQPPQFRPHCTTQPQPTSQVAYVWKTEEKGSDVNLGVHLVRDAFMKAFDHAAILTNDSDLTDRTGKPMDLAERARPRIRDAKQDGPRRRQARMASRTTIARGDTLRRIRPGRRSQDSNAQAVRLLRCLRRRSGRAQLPGVQARSRPRRDPGSRPTHAR
jgi:hypothetical protein